MNLQEFIKVLKQFEKEGSKEVFFGNDEEMNQVFKRPFFQSIHETPSFLIITPRQSSLVNVWQEAENRNSEINRCSKCGGQFDESYSDCDCIQMPDETSDPPKTFKTLLILTEKPYTLSGDERDGWTCFLMDHGLYDDLGSLLDKPDCFITMNDENRKAVILLVKETQKEYEHR